MVQSKVANMLITINPKEMEQIIMAQIIMELVITQIIMEQIMAQIIMELAITQIIMELAIPHPDHLVLNHQHQVIALNNHQLKLLHQNQTTLVLQIIQVHHHLPQLIVAVQAIHHHHPPQIVAVQAIHHHHPLLIVAVQVIHHHPHQREDYKVLVQLQQLLHLNQVNHLLLLIQLRTTTLCQPTAMDPIKIMEVIMATKTKINMVMEIQLEKRLMALKQF